MTIYQFDVEIPADTSKDDPVEVEAEIEEEVLVRGLVVFPAGCRGMVESKIMYGQLQIAPRPFGAVFKGDNIAIPFELWRILPDRPTKLRLLAWSPGTSYKHTITYYLIALPYWVAFWYVGLHNFVKILGQLTGIPVEEARPI